MTDNEEGREPRTRHLDLSATQLIGGSLAAATAAFLGSRLGVAGTILGAAAASVISAVAVSLYTASIQRSGELIKKVPAVLPTSRPRPASTKSASTGAIPTSMPETKTDTEAATGSTPAESATDTISATPSEDTPSVWERMRERWQVIAVSAVAVFALTAFLITGTELLTGRSLDGSAGTTAGGAVSQVDRNSNNGDDDQRDNQPTEDVTEDPSDQPADDPTSQPADGNDQPDQQPTDGATDDAEQPGDESTDQPTKQPTQEPTEEPTEEPTTAPTAPAPSPSAKP